MNVVAFNGSARRKGNTALLLKTVADVLDNEGIRTETVHLAGESIHGCIACRNHFFMIGQMIVPGASYWNIGIGLDRGDAAGDAEGIQTMQTLGKNMTWLMQRLHS